MHARFDRKIPSKSELKDGVCKDWGRPSHVIVAEGRGLDDLKDNPALQFQSNVGYVYRRPRFNSEKRRDSNDSGTIGRAFYRGRTGFMRPAKKFSHVPNMSRDSMIEVGPLPSVPVTRNEVQSESKREVLE